MLYCCPRRKGVSVEVLGRSFNILIQTLILFLNYSGSSIYRRNFNDFVQGYGRHSVFGLGRRLHTEVGRLPPSISFTFPSKGVRSPAESAGSPYSHYKYHTENEEISTCFHRDSIGCRGRHCRFWF